MKWYQDRLTDDNLGINQRTERPSSIEGLMLWGIIVLHKYGYYRR